MNTVNENALDFMKLVVNKAQIKVSKHERGREAVNFIVKTHNGTTYCLCNNILLLFFFLYLYQ